MPAIIAAQKSMAGVPAMVKAASAGPGQKPTRPQPSPKMIAPPISLGSISLRNCIFAFLSNNGNVSFFTKRHAQAIGISAPTITKASVGSQEPNISKKPRTFSGFIMPEMVKPKPKIRPEMREITI